MVTPAALPFEDYHKNLPNLNQFEKLKIIRKAHKQASYILQIQKTKTGVAILRSPCKELINNLIFQGNLKHYFLQVGEDLAKKAPTAEK